MQWFVNACPDCYLCERQVRFFVFVVSCCGLDWLSKELVSCFWLPLWESKSGSYLWVFDRCEVMYLRVGPKKVVFDRRCVCFCDTILGRTCFLREELFCWKKLCDRLIYLFLWVVAWYDQCDGWSSFCEWGFVWWAFVILFLPALVLCKNNF